MTLQKNDLPTSIKAIYGEKSVCYASFLACQTDIQNDPNHPFNLLLSIYSKDIEQTKNSTIAMTISNSLMSCIILGCQNFLENTTNITIPKNTDCYNSDIESLIERTRILKAEPVISKQTGSPEIRLLGTLIYASQALLTKESNDIAVAKKFLENLKQYNMFELSNQNYITEIKSIENSLEI